MTSKDKVKTMCIQWFLVNTGLVHSMVILQTSIKSGVYLSVNVPDDLDCQAQGHLHSIIFIIFFHKCGAFFCFKNENNNLKECWHVADLLVNPAEILLVGC